MAGQKLNYWPDSLQQKSMKNCHAQDCKPFYDQVAVLVVSCDNYSDLWQPFFTLFRRFWSDCPFQVYLLSNHIQCSEPEITTILVGDDISWSDNVQCGLKQIKQDYVFMFIEDLFLVDRVQTERIVELFCWIIEAEANYVRLNPHPKPDKPYNDLVGLVSAGTIYRTATVLSVWKKDVLSDLLMAGENAWEFELKGTMRSDKYDNFFSTWQKLLFVENGVIKGKWQRHVLNRLKLLKIEIIHDKRQIMTFKETAIFKFIILRSKILNFFPSKYRRIIRKLCTSTK